MHILFLTHSFPPEVNASHSHTLDQRREWVRQGQRVTIITCDARRLWQTQEIDGIRVIRVCRSIPAISVIAALFVSKVDVVVGTSPHSLTGLSAWIVSLFKRRPLIVEARAGLPGPVELFLYRRAFRIVSVTDAFKENLVAHGVKGSKIHVLATEVDLALKMLEVLRGIRILILNQAFWPDVVATAQHADDLARFMVAHGDDVTVVASRAIYGERGSSLPKREVRATIEIYRVGLQLFGKGGIASRVFDFTLFYLAAAWRCLILPRHDVVICFTTPPFIALVGVALKWIKGTRVVYWTMDLYPDVAGALGLMKRGTLLWRVLQWIDRLCLRHSDRVVALGQCMKRIVIAKGARPESVRTICVWSGAETIADRPRGHNPLRTEWRIGDRFTILYLGNFGLGHDMEAIAGAVERLKENDAIRWLFIGEGKSKHILEERVRACSATNVIVKGYQTREQLADVLDVGDSHLVTLQLGWDGLILPSKFFSVLAASKPVLWVGPSGSECVTILREHRCGFEIAVGDSRELTERIQFLISHEAEAHAMGKRGRMAYDSKYSVQRACEHWRGVLHDVTSARR